MYALMLRMYDSRINDTISMYVIVSFISLLTNYLANVCMNTSAERQVRKMRLDFFETAFLL